MKTASTAMINFLASLAEVYEANLYTITLLNGTVLYYTDGDGDILFNGNIFLSHDAQFSRSQITQKLGLETDALQVSVKADTFHVVNGVPILQAIATGQFDGATLRIERLMMATYGDTSNGSVVMFVGTISNVDEVGRTRAQFTVKSMLELLNMPMPLNLYTPGCRHTLYDPGCTLLKTNFAVNGTIVSGSNTNKLQSNLTQVGPLAAPAAAPTLGHASAHSIPAQTYYVQTTYVNPFGETNGSPEGSIALLLNQRLTVTSPPASGNASGWNCYVGMTTGSEQQQNATVTAIGTNFTMPDFIQSSQPGKAVPTLNQSGYFSLGTILFTSGTNNGLSRAIAAYEGAGVIDLVVALPAAPLNGDTFTIFPGCDKQLSTCIQKFNNVIHFGGFPWIPVPETSI